MLNDGREGGGVDERRYAIAQASYRAPPVFKYQNHNKITCTCVAFCTAGSVLSHLKAPREL